MNTVDVESRLARLRIGVPPEGVPLCMLPDPDGFYSAWSEAREQTERALAAWKRDRGPETYWAYRAAADREDRAQDWLADPRRAGDSAAA
jgi:hypothetical protein